MVNCNLKSTQSFRWRRFCHTSCKVFFLWGLHWCGSASNFPEHSAYGSTSCWSRTSRHRIGRQSIACDLSKSERESYPTKISYRRRRFAANLGKSWGNQRKGPKCQSQICEYSRSQTSSVFRGPCRAQRTWEFEAPACQCCLVWLIPDPSSDREWKLPFCTKRGASRDDADFRAFA